MQIHSTFENSSNALLSVLQGITLFLVGASPWLPFVIIGGLVLRYVIRKYQPAAPEF